MRSRLIKTVALLAFAAYSTLALAQDPPARVGRIALAQGQVTIGGAAGERAEAALLNWPVAAGDRVTTARGARTELQIGSTSVRLDGDSALDVAELTDDTLRLRLHYGSASIRLANPEVLDGFELTTPQGRVRMQDTGRLRVDAERVRDTSLVSVFEGVARVEGGGASLTVRAGRSAELTDQDVRTAQAFPDAFDDWALARDRAYTSTTATRYVAPEMTGHAELDRYGSWRIDNEYGALWVPTVAPGWVPYRDGRWAWIDPWGWTWVDNAPWGYAPFHYGRWVYLPRHKHWAWAPGHRHHRPAWAPALVGWVGGAGWTVTFDLHKRRLRAPAHGWYPLSPHDQYVPHYHASNEHLRRLNDRRDDRRRRHDPDHKRHGLTVLPQDQFGQRGHVPVPKTPLVALPPPVHQAVPASAPPAPPAGARQRDWRRGELHAEDGRWRDRRHEERRPPASMPAPVLSTNPAPPPRQPVTVATPAPRMPGQPPEPVRPPVTAVTPPPQLPGQPAQPPQPVMPNLPQPRQPVTVLTPAPVLPGQQAQPVAPAAQPRWHDARREHVEEDGRRRVRPGRWTSTEEAEGAPAPAPQAAVAPVPQAAPAPMPAPQRFARPEVEHRLFERQREMREAPARIAAPPQQAMPAAQPMAVAPAPVARPVPTPMPAPAASAMQPPPAAAAARAAARHAGRDERGLRHQEP